MYNFFLFRYLIREINHFASGLENEYLVEFREFHESKATREVNIQEGDAALDNLKRNQ